MPAGFGFLKYGKPMVAAAPILLALNALPGPAAACTGSPNDPPHCANNNGQVINGFGNFYRENLLVVPGSTTVGDDQETIYHPLTGRAFGSRSRSLSFSNNTVGGGNPISSSGFTGVPLPTPGPGQTPGGGFTDFYTGGGSGGTTLQTFDSPESFAGFNDDEGDLPTSFDLFLSVPGENEGLSCSQGSPELCTQAFEPVFQNFTIALVPENRDAILGAAAIDDNDTGEFIPLTPLEGFDEDDLQTGGRLEQIMEAYGLNSDDPGANELFRQLVIRYGANGGTPTPEPEIEADDAQPISAPPTPESPKENFAQRQLDSLNRLRAQAAAEKNIERKRELEARVARIENSINLFGSSALRAGLQAQDNRTVPVPRR